MFHTIIIVGNVGQNPEMRYTPSGTPVTSFSVASNRTSTDSSGQQVKETIWFRVTCWNRLAETAGNYLKKGSKVLVEGRLSPDPATGRPKMWTRSDGTSAASYDVNASTVRFLSNRNENEGGASGAASGGDFASPVVEEGDEDIPF